MSMVSVKTLEIAGVRVPDLSKCKDIFEKYSKFYKEEDVLEILEVTARNTDVVNLFLESVSCPLNGQKISGMAIFNSVVEIYKPLIKEYHTSTLMALA